MRLCELLEGQVSIRVQSMRQSRGVRGHAPLDFGLFIRRNLVESGTVFTHYIYHLLCHHKA